MLSFGTSLLHVPHVNMSCAAMFGGRVSAEETAASRQLRVIALEPMKASRQVKVASDDNSTVQACITMK